jgi:hypothetical protein
MYCPKRENTMLGLWMQHGDRTYQPSLHVTLNIVTAFHRAPSAAWTVLLVNSRKAQLRGAMALRTMACDRHMRYDHVGAP